MKIDFGNLSHSYLLSIVFVQLLAATTLVAQTGAITCTPIPGHPNNHCQCDTQEPENGLTNCVSEWTDYKVNVVTVNFPAHQLSCDIEVHVFCRVREAGECQKFNQVDLSASCETYISCIRVPKDCLADYAEPGQPLQKDLRDRLVHEITKAVACANWCGHGLPTVPGEDPYEWVITVPKCLYFCKTSAPNEGYWCLQNCGTSYCVYAMLMGYNHATSKPQLLNVTQVEWIWPGTNGNCTIDPNCTEIPCIDEFDPDCEFWD